MSTNEITGDSITTGYVSDSYRNNWEAIFGKKKPHFHRNRTLPQDQWIFVFGSNESGIHGAGAAKVALDKFGAVWGIGEGHVGMSYAIPTKDHEIKTLDLDKIRPHINKFNEYVADHPELRFFVTALGTELAGYKHEDIAPMFIGYSNCSFPEEWRGLV